MLEVLGSQGLMEQAVWPWVMAAAMFQELVTLLLVLLVVLLVVSAVVSVVAAQVGAA